MPAPNLRFLIPVAIVAALGVGGWYVERQRARERSTLSGFFESQPTEIASRIAGRVAAIKVREGDAVRQGDLILALEARPAEADRDAAAARADQAKAAAEQAQNGPRIQEIEAQAAAVAEARAALEKLRHGSRKEDIAVARARVDQAAAEYRKALAGPRPQEIAEARAAERAAASRLAQSERGLTPEERAEFRARYDAAAAAENLATIEYNRTRSLYLQDADSRQHLDRVRSDLQTAHARTAEAQEALKRAELGTPKEELDQAREGYRQARAALDLALAGTRREDIQSARGALAAARQQLALLANGSRPEDIQAAEAHLGQAQAKLDELRAGSRREEIAAARDAARAAAAQARSARIDAGEREVRAPRAGTIERILVADGDLVRAETPVARLASQSDIWIRVYVPESSLARVRVGAPAALRVDGIASDVPAVVESIATQGEFTPVNLQTPDERGKQVFAARLRLVKADPAIRAGMFATVRSLGGVAW
ncbi:MAG TPA: HlyD family efflux transporter periplasmic adaptor subunit [Chthonomonadaceae bacterium]|nr:HlyD family efflux transporter periplasmic adaptor subunit [Chthonomonadaceae bacterium]